MTKNRLAMIVALCALAVFATASFGMDGMAVSPGGWYHVSAQFFATNSAQNACGSAVAPLGADTSSA